MDGLELAARFSAPPNSLCYCGKKTFFKAFMQYLKNKQTKNLENEMKKFKAHYEYLKLISSENNLPLFDKKVVEAFWIGNELLENVRKESIAKMILTKFTGKGLLSKKKAKALVANLPEKIVPHHSFHVLYLHTITNIISPSIKNADKCRISWGKVISVSNQIAKIKSQKLLLKEGKLTLSPITKKVKLLCNDFKLISPKVGDYLACHWETAVVKINKNQLKNLKKYTINNINAINQIQTSEIVKIKFINKKIKNK